MIGSERLIPTSETSVCRRWALSPDALLEPPGWLAIGSADVDGLRRVVSRMRSAAHIEGAAAVLLDRALTGDEFLDFARAWGRPIEEQDPAVQSFVEQACILNLIARWDATDDVDRQPFSTSPILMHTEGSRRPLAAQPRHLLFQCLDPPEPGEGGHTMLVRMEDVAARLTSQVRSVLQNVRYRGQGMPPILRYEDGLPVFSFRDFGSQPLEWISDTPVASADVEDALATLVDALYDPSIVYGLAWRRHLLVAIDNRRLFHGRTAAIAPRLKGKGRVLQRIRVAPAFTPGGARSSPMCP